MVSLKTLELSHNLITELHDNVWKLPKLESIELSHNQISKLPIDIWKETNFL